MTEKSGLPTVFSSPVAGSTETMNWSRGEGKGGNSPASSFSLGFQRIQKS
jgi:hypothetical protein